MREEVITRVIAYLVNRAHSSSGCLKAQVNLHDSPYCGLIKLKTREYARSSAVREQGRRLLAEQVKTYWRVGHITIPDVFDEVFTNLALTDAVAWAEESLLPIEGKKRLWCVEHVLEVTVPRKLENPHLHRPPIAALAFSAELLARLLPCC
jgi:hypothetical protein